MYRVCIIEDEDILREGLINGYSWDDMDCVIVGSASDGLEGYKVITKEKPNIIILDINMPIMNGIELLEKLPRDTYAVIVISGHTEFEYAHKAIEFGVSEYLLKPIEPEELRNSIHKAIEKIKRQTAYTPTEEIALYKALDVPQYVDSITLTKALKYIKENYAQKISLNDLSDYTGRSHSSINNRFQKHLYMTFNDYLTRYRIQRALELIEKQQYRLYEISEMVGFNDYKYFNQVFHKIINTSPKIVNTYYARKKRIP